jgi:tetratricopeptide (TPR) repeat protein
VENARPAGQASTEDPASTQYRLMEGQYLGWLGRTASAGERYRRLMQENPSDAAAQEGFGNTHLWRGNWPEAQRAYASAISTSGADNVTATLAFQRAQPADAWPELWAQKWADAHGGEVNGAALQSLIGVATRYEFATLDDTTDAGAKLQAWHEGVGVDLKYGFTEKLSIPPTTAKSPTISSISTASG